MRMSELAGQTGFIPVDAHTLRAEADGVFAIGDVTQIPIAGGKFLPKAGVFAHGEAEVVAGTIVKREPRRVLRGARHTCDDDPPILERLPEPFDRVPTELGEFVQEEHAVMARCWRMSPDLHVG